MEKQFVKLEFRNNKDFWSGFMFFAIGASSIFTARNYPFGTALNMGPGFFPVVLGGILILFGIYIMMRGLRINAKIEGNWSIRALIMLPLSMVLFGILMTVLGFVPALVALISVSAVAGRECKIVDFLLLNVLLISLSVALFVLGLGLPYPLIKF